MYLNARQHSGGCVLFSANTVQNITWELLGELDFNDHAFDFCESS